MHEQNLARLEALSVGGGRESPAEQTAVIIAELKKMFRDGRELLRLNNGLVEVERERLAADRKQLVGCTDEFSPHVRFSMLASLYFSLHS